MANVLVRFHRDERPAEFVITREPKTLDDLQAAELDAKLQHSYAQSLTMEGRPFAAVFDEIEGGISVHGHL